MREFNSSSTVVPSEPGAYSIEAFCKAHGISRSFFYLLLNRGEGPRLTKVGRRTLISREAAHQWRNRSGGDLDRAAA